MTPGGNLVTAPLFVDQATLQALADAAKRVIDPAIARFRGKKATASLARRMELAIVRAIAADPALAAIHGVQPVVMFQEDGRPHVMFMPRQQPPANDRRSVA